MIIENINIVIVERIFKGIININNKDIEVKISLIPYDTYRNAYTATLFFDNKEIQSEKISINDEDLVDDIEFAYSMTYKALIDYYKISRNSGNLSITITKPFEEEK